MEWQLIETAPKDGTTIFGSNWKLGQRGLVHMNSKGEWEMVDGLSNMPTGNGFHPTHWMPEPAPPSWPTYEIGQEHLESEVICGHG